MQIPILAQPVEVAEPTGVTTIPVPDELGPVDVPLASGAPISFGRELARSELNAHVTTNMPAQESAMAALHAAPIRCASHSRADCEEPIDVELTESEPQTPGPIATTFPTSEIVEAGSTSSLEPPVRLTHRVQEAAVRRSGTLVDFEADSARADSGPKVEPQPSNVPPNHQALRGSPRSTSTGEEFGDVQSFPPDNNLPSRELEFPKIVEPTTDSAPSAPTSDSVDIAARRSGVPQASANRSTADTDNQTKSSSSQNTELELISSLPSASISNRAVTTSQTVVASRVSEIETPVVGQVSNHIVTATHKVRDGSSTLEVTLDPPDLGRITIEVTESEDKLSARLRVSEARTMDAIRSGMPSILDSLADAGVALEGFDLDEHPGGDLAHDHSHERDDEAREFRRAEVQRTSRATRSTTLSRINLLI